MPGPMMGPDDTEIPPAGKSVDVDFGAVAHWEDGQTTKERLFCDLVGIMKQIGPS